MIKNIFLVCGIFSFNFFKAQINFEHGTWAQVLEKAKKENKPIFVDAYTTWCGPCKAMARTTFKNDTVAKFYNEKFINYKIDAEKGEGIEFSKKYDVNCYPNLLVIDASGKLIHRAAGYLSNNEFIAYGQNGLSNDKNFSHYKSKIESQGLKKENVLSYMELMNGACLNADDKIAEYIKTVPEAELADNANWNVFYTSVKDPKSREANYFYLNYNLFEKKYAKDSVKSKAISLGTANFKSHFKSKTPDVIAFENDKAAYASKKQPYYDEVLFLSDIQFYRTHKNEKYYEVVSSDWTKYLNNNHSALNSHAWNFFEGTTEKKYLQAAASMASKACELNANYAYYDTYAAVQYKLGNLIEAKTLATKSIELAKKDGMQESDYKETSELLNKIEKAVKK